MLKNNLLIVFAEKKTNASKVSNETGIAESTISNLTNNKTDVKLSTLQKAAAVFGKQLKIAML